ncbi:(R)-mandelonitrile lyase [Galbitalea soli]|uniref:Cupin domain-containing protein n=1 Tax=Galbitalea soli TaxID=1268042 RepID=A0A7C9TSR7_9MICO|nr:cupin domain-containing protein [Galbitalea soli]NEM91962.1 cupin domain-containing protein [Galbitalea soli]NYJ32090.1 quercetin dioxygenase-like cupin family protein [Galbitalea soli]
MEIVTLPPTATGPAALFTGHVWFDVIAPPQPGIPPLKVNLVHFSPGARTAWHSHALGQTLHITEGAGYVQSRGGELRKVLPGQTIYTPPGEEHWHGAAPDHFMSHLAMWVGTESPDVVETTWAEHVSEEEYPKA